MRYSALFLLFVFGFGPSGGALQPLSIHFTDVEGGAATLIVTPAGESVLIDSGFPGERDAARIHRTATEAGLARIDHLITTHWHNDHFGGVEPLSAKIPIGQIYDRGGLSIPPQDQGTDPKLIEAYRRVAGNRSRPLRAGEEVPLRQAPGSPPVSLRTIVSNALLEGERSPEGGLPSCKEHPPKPPDPSDNAKSLGFILRFGEFEFLDLGDLTWNVEHRLICPQNRIGKVDLYQVTHHGLDSSNNPALLRAVRPRVAVINNGPRKGGSKSVYSDLKALPELEAVFQLHRNVTTTEADNAPADHIANLVESCQGEPVTVRLAPDSRTYTVQVGRGGLKRSFTTR